MNCNSVQPCNLCPCNSSSIPWHHFSFAAQWLDRIYTTTEWVASGAATAEIFKIEGVTNDSLYPDWMHAKYLGTDKVLGGSVLYLLVFFMLPNSVAQNLIIIWSDIQREYRLQTVKHRFGSLTVNMFAGKKAASAKLRGTAAEVKCIIPVLHSIWKKYSTGKYGEVETNVEITLRTSVEMEALLEATNGEFAMPDDEASSLLALGMTHYNAFWELRQHFAEDDFPIFQLTSKGRYVLHACLLASSLHPCLAWAFTGEDFMGKIRTLAQSCSKGVFLWEASNKVQLRWLVAMHLLFTDPTLWFRRIME